MLGEEVGESRSLGDTHAERINFSDNSSQKCENQDGILATEVFFTHHKLDVLERFVKAYIRSLRPVRFVN